MMRKLVCLLAMGALLAALAGCGKKKVVDPYVKASLKEATYGEVASEGFTYKIVKPEIIDTLGNFIVARQGNLTGLVTGNDIAAHMAKLTDMSSLTFNVVKRFRPVVYFQCLSIVTPKDSILIPQEKPIAFPRISDAESYEPPADYTPTDMTQLRYDNTAGLQELLGKKLAIRGRLVHVDQDTTKVWMLEGEKPCPSPYLPTPQRVVPAKLRVKQPRPVLEIVLRMLEKTDQDFVGGVTFVGVEPIASRGEDHICGTVEIGYIRFGDKVYAR
jgi:hypothetical protein